MSRARGYLSSAGVMLLMVGLTGCIFAPPVLQVTPLALNIPQGVDVATFRVMNSGGQSLSWQAAEDLPWISLSLRSDAKQSETVASDVTTGVDVVEVRIDRTLLPLGASNGEVRITSNGGAQTVRISTTKTSPAQLGISDSDIDFGLNGTLQTFNIRNDGQEALNWTLAVSEDAPWLSATPREGTTSGAGATTQVTLRANRSGLTGGTHTGTITVSSNGGSATINASIFVPPFSVAPASIEFGVVTRSDSQTLTVSNNSGAPLSLTLTATTDDGGNWLAVDLPTVNLPGGTSQLVLVNADVTGLAPAVYTGSIRILDAASSFETLAPVRLELSGFSVSRGLIDFGSITAEQSDTFAIRNAGATPIAYSISVPPADARWLSVSSTNGNVNAEDIITVTVKPAAVDPGTFSSTLTISFEGGQATVRVRFVQPRPAELKVEPSDIDFGTTRTEELLGIWNDGIGTINWRIDTTGFPAWLVLTPVNGLGIASGTVSGDATDAVTLRVDRNLAPAGVFILSHSFTAEAAGDSTTPVPVQVRAEVPKVPRFALEADGVDETGVATLGFAADQSQRTFSIRNDLGSTGILTWRIDEATIPFFITSISPQQGSLEPNTQQTVTVTISREGLTFLGAQATLSIITNDPERPRVPLLVSVVVERKESIGARPGAISFGLTGVTTLLEVANFGDPETELNFFISTTKDWVDVFPRTGKSIGTAGNIKDFQPVSVSIDRSLLDTSDSSAMIIIQAFEIDGENQVPKPEIMPLQISVSAEAAKLTIESAKPRTRIPSLVRTVLLMRNLRFQALPIADTRLDEVGRLFRLFEDNEALEITETNQFLTTGSRLRTNVFVLLDYSGSMLKAAQTLVEDGQLGDINNPPADPLQLLYEETISFLIDSLPADYRVCIGVFNDRSTDPVRIIRPAGEPAFIKDKLRLQQRLMSIDVQDNGATQLLPAVVRAAEIIANEDSTFLFPFDDAEVRALVCVTDGRLTTPPGNFSDARDFLADRRVRFMGVGWGENVSRDPLIRLSQPTGGHFYSSRTKATESVDPFGLQVRLPLFDSLLGWCRNDLGDPCDQSIAKDLMSQVVLSYATLREESSVRVEGRISFFDQNDGPLDPLDPNSIVCVEEQGQISGNFEHRENDFLSIVGDTRLGQISLVASRIENNEATVIVRGDYMPRNISGFEFDISVSPPGAATMEVVRAPFGRGGMISNWTASFAPPRFRFDSPDDPLKYGEFGNLLELRFTNVAGPFAIDFEVVSPALNADPNSKYFTHPTTVFVDSVYGLGADEIDEFHATAFPRPSLVGPVAPTIADPLTYDFGTTLFDADFFLFNLGGSHVILDNRGDVDEERSVGLGYTLFEAGSSLLTISPFTGFVTASRNFDTINVAVNRSFAPGRYTAEISSRYEFGAISLSTLGEPIFIEYEILPPALEVTPPSIDFGAALTSQELTIANVGQSLMQWNLNLISFPVWLGASFGSNTVGPEDSQVITLSVFRTGLAPGVYNFTLEVNAGDAGQQFVPITMTVP